MGGLRPAWSSQFDAERLAPVSPVPLLDRITPEEAWGGSTGKGVRVAVFRNESAILSSELIRVHSWVPSLRPLEAQSTSAPPARSAAPTAAPISPGWSSPTRVTASGRAPRR